MQLGKWLTFTQSGKNSVSSVKAPRGNSSRPRPCCRRGNCRCRTGTRAAWSSTPWSGPTAGRAPGRRGRSPARPASRPGSDRSRPRPSRCPGRSASASEKSKAVPFTDAISPVGMSDGIHGEVEPGGDESTWSSTEPVAGEVPVGVVGQVDGRGLVGDRPVLEGQLAVLVQRVHHVGLQRARVAFLAVPAGVGRSARPRRPSCGTARAFHRTLSKPTVPPCRWLPVSSPCTCQLVLLAVEGELPGRRCGSRTCPTSAPQNMGCARYPARPSNDRMTFVAVPLPVGDLDAAAACTRRSIIGERSCPRPF